MRMTKDEAIDYTLRIASAQKDAYESLVLRLKYEMDERLAGESKSWQYEIYQAHTEGANVAQIMRAMGLKRPEVVKILAYYGVGVAQ